MVHLARIVGVALIQRVWRSTELPDDSNSGCGGLEISPKIEEFIMNKHL